MSSNLSNTLHYDWQFGFERSFSYAKARRWMTELWYLPSVIGAVYVLAVFGGKYLMRNRSPFQLGNTLILWNVLMALFSILASVRFLPDFFYILNNFGFRESACGEGFIDGPVGRWTQLFVLSKSVELIDTAFLVLRKREVIFLHWYHHLIVVVYTWRTYITQLSVGRWFVALNYPVHSVMYSYFALRAAGVKLPRMLAGCITVIQTVQMFVALYVVSFAILSIHQGIPCETTYSNLWMAIVMYGSFAVLFTQFFLKSQSRANPPKTVTSQKVD